MPAICNEPAFAHQEPIDAASQADREAAHAFDERRAITCFKDEVQVIGLNGEFDDAKVEGISPIGRVNGAAHRGKHELTAQ